MGHSLFVIAAVPITQLAQYVFIYPNVGVKRCNAHTVHIKQNERLFYGLILIEDDANCKAKNLTQLLWFKRKCSVVVRENVNLLMSENILWFYHYSDVIKVENSIKIVYFLFRSYIMYYITLLIS